MDFKPRYEFTIPSVYDETPLACRLYDVADCFFKAGNGGTPWIPKGAIVVHPLTFLGGSYDDPVVLDVVADLITLGFVVGTFNLRGRPGASSKWKSTLTSVAEMQDYASFVGFFIDFLSMVGVLVRGADSTLQMPKLSPVISGVPLTTHTAHLILAGYSYGSYLTQKLSNTPHVFNRSKIIEGGAQSEIRMRAVDLATVYNFDTKTNSDKFALSAETRVQRPRSNRPLVSTEMGKVRPARSAGEIKVQWSTGTLPSEQLKIDEITPKSDSEKAEKRANAWDALQTVYPKRKWWMRGWALPPGEENFYMQLDIPTPTIHYLIISPLVGLIASFFNTFFWLKDAKGDKLLGNNTLVIHGAKDGLVSTKRLRPLCYKRYQEAKGKFKYVQIEEAGHFWNKRAANQQMRAEVRHWAGRCLRGLDSMGSEEFAHEGSSEKSEKGIDGDGK